MRNKNPVISILIASYNHESYIKEAIDSILNQTYTNFELIITDDGSADNSVNVIKTITDSRVRLFEFKHNKGACEATNNSLKHAKGQYIAIMNSDDVWVQDKLEKQITILEKNEDIDAVFSSAGFFDVHLQPFTSDKQPYFADIFNQKNRSSATWLQYFFYNGNCLCHPSILIRKSCYDELGLYDNRFRQLPDFDMWIKFCKKFTLHVLPEKLVKFRILDDNRNASSPSIENRIRGNNEHFLIMESFFDGMSIDTFKEAFFKQLRNPKFESEIEFKIEKAFIFLNSAFCIIGIKQLYELLGQEQCTEILNNKYNFGDKEFQKVLSSNNSFNIQDSSSLVRSLFFKVLHYPKIALVKLIFRKTYSYLRNKFIK